MAPLCEPHSCVAVGTKSSWPLQVCTPGGAGSCPGGLSLSAWVCRLGHSSDRCFVPLSDLQLFEVAWRVLADYTLTES